MNLTLINWVLSFSPILVFLFLMIGKKMERKQGWVC